MTVMSVRLSDAEQKRIQAVARAEDKEKSKVARELMLDGLKFKMLLAYKDGKASLSLLSKTLGMNLSDTVDFLASFGLNAPISYDDYLAGADTAKKVIR
jgi:hypothetical protein